MAGGSGKGTIVAALIGNSTLTTIKLVAFVFSGSGAMLSEAIHSFADTGNQALLYLGVRRSERPADAMFHYGYGAERFFFALMSAIGIFVLGCGVTVYHGVHNLVDPPDISVSWVTFAVLGIALVLDAAVLAKAISAIAKARGEMPFWRFARESDDPTLLAVLFEDAVATAGVLIAAAGIGLSLWTGSPVFDAVASILIGLLMGAVAVWLGWRNRTLLLGPSMPPDVQKEVTTFLEDHGSVQAVRNVKSRILGAGRFRLAAEVDFDGRVLGRRQVGWIREQIPRLTGDGAVEGFAEDLGERLMDELGREVDRLEKGIAERFPDLKHLDLETDWREGD